MSKFSSAVLEACGIPPFGLMIESVSPRLLWSGGPHGKAPDKVPALRIKASEQAG
jgi:hypothetical protein